MSAATMYYVFLCAIFSFLPKKSIILCNNVTIYIYTWLCFIYFNAEWTIKYVHIILLWYNTCIRCWTYCQGQSLRTNSGLVDIEHMTCTVGIWSTRHLSVTANIAKNINISDLSFHLANFWKWCPNWITKFKIEEKFLVKSEK